MLFLGQAWGDEAESILELPFLIFFINVRDIGS